MIDIHSLTPRERRLMDAAQNALDDFKSEVNPDDPDDVPPSAFLAALRMVASYEGWDWYMAHEVAIKHGTAFAHEIAERTSN